MHTQGTPAAGSPDRGKALYDLNRTTVFAHREDARFSYCLYVPPQIEHHAERPELVVMVHGTRRTFTDYRDQLAEFGRWNYCIVLCPLFPAGVLGDGNRDGFKHIEEGGIRYDQVLLGMVREVGEKYACAFERFALAGYSGGGQFVNRFAFLHPRRLWAACIGAPGSVTLLDPDRNWWVGTGGMRGRFGLDPDLAALRQVPMHLVVGSADLETWEITHREGSRHWMPGANDAGATRPQRLASLERSLRSAGVDASLDIVPGVAHDGTKCLDRMKTFLAARLGDRRREAGRDGDPPGPN